MAPGSTHRPAHRLDRLEAAWTGSAAVPFRVEDSRERDLGAQRLQRANRTPTRPPTYQSTPTVKGPGSSALAKVSKRSAVVSG